MNTKHEAPCSMFYFLATKPIPHMIFENFRITNCIEATEAERIIHEALNYLIKLNEFKETDYYKWGQRKVGK